MLPFNSKERADADAARTTAELAAIEHTCIRTNDSTPRVYDHWDADGSWTAEQYAFRTSRSRVVRDTA